MADDNGDTPPETNWDKYNFDFMPSNLLSTRKRSYLVRNSGEEVDVDHLDGKLAVLYFSAACSDPCNHFTSMLLDVYTELSAKRADFEVVFVSADDTAEAFTKGFSMMPWISIPYSDFEARNTLIACLNVTDFPEIVCIDEYGNVLPNDGIGIISRLKELKELNKQLLTTTPEKIMEKEKAVPRKQTLESILVSGELNFVIQKDGTEVPVSTLCGKTILLFFSALWCPISQKLTNLLAVVYKKLLRDKENVEIIFISGDKNKASFELNFSRMPWLALPFGDMRRESLIGLFEVRSIPKLIALGQSGETVTTEARDLVFYWGKDSFPFTEGRVRVLESHLDNVSSRWPKKLRYKFHLAHDLLIDHCQVYQCKKCQKIGRIWGFSCRGCSYFVHPWCALDMDRGYNKDGWLWYY